MKRRVHRFLVLLDDLLEILILRVMLGTSWRRRATASLAVLAWLTSGMWMATYDVDVRTLDRLQAPVHRPFELDLSAEESEALADCVVSGKVELSSSWAITEQLTRRHRAVLDRLVALSRRADRLATAPEHAISTSIWLGQLLACRGMLGAASGENGRAAEDWIALVRLGNAISETRPGQPALVHALVGFNYQALGLMMLEKAVLDGETAAAVSQALRQRKSCARQYVAALGAEIEAMAARVEAIGEGGNWWVNMSPYVRFYLPARESSRREMLAEFIRIQREAWARVAAIMLTEEPSERSVERQSEVWALSNWTSPSDWIAGLFSPAAAGRILVRATSRTRTHLNTPFRGNEEEVWNIDRRAQRLLAACERTSEGR